VFRIFSEEIDIFLEMVTALVSSPKHGKAMDIPSLVSSSKTTSALGSNDSNTTSSGSGGSSSDEAPAKVYSREEIDQALATLAETRKKCETVLENCRAHQIEVSTESLEAKWDEFKRKFDEMNKCMINNLGHMLGVQVPHKRVLEDIPEETRMDVFNGKSPSLELICEGLKSGKYKRVVVMAGAGMSVSAGIPDFRSPGTGLYASIADELREKYKITNPQAVFDIAQFRETPRAFLERAKQMMPGSYAPTVCHHFVKLLSEKRLLHRLYTQNIDSLEQIAGIPENRTVFAHGNYGDVHCIDCGKRLMLEEWKQFVDNDEIPRCIDTKCGGLAKPDIVFFGENLPQRFHEMNGPDLQAADLLIIVGTSLRVAPFNSLIHKVSDACPRLLINNEKLSGFDFDSEENYRDYFVESDIDKAILHICNLLNWKEELASKIARATPIDGWNLMVKHQEEKQKRETSFS